nr:gamma-glutamylcyclotransferase family protein [Candidatus Sigynarchaeota archaeon]
MVVMIFGYGHIILQNYSTDGVVARVSNYKRIYHPSPLYSFDYPYVIEKPGATCLGILVESNDEDATLTFWDAHERYPDLYDRIMVDVEIIEDKLGIVNRTGQKVKAWMYVPSPKTLSLTLDPVFKRMKRMDLIAYKEMMVMDTWLIKIKNEYPDIVAVLPSLFNGIEDPVDMTTSGKNIDDQRQPGNTSPRER